jgi:Ca2+-binding RTX toxin-like protein
MLINGSPYNDNDTVNGDGKFHPKLIGMLENDSIYGLTGNDIIYGLAGNDYIDGDKGETDAGKYADVMYGGTGGDIYIVNHVNDKVFENANEGSDSLRSFVTYTMPNNVESLYLQGNANINGFGNNQDNTSLIGNNGSNYLRGGNGSNILNGLGGADTLEGVGTSDDVYVVDGPGDKIVDGQTGKFQRS